MKKILIVIAFVFLIFQLIVLAINIEIGTEAIDGTAFFCNNYTTINRNGSANASGTITSVEIWVKANMSDVEVATFYITGVNEFSTRDSELIGSVTAGAKRTFVVDIDVQTGDYIGFYTTAGNAAFQSGTGGTVLRLEGDYIPCTEEVFEIVSDDWTISLYGSGVGVEVEEENVIFFAVDF